MNDLTRAEVEALLAVSDFNMMRSPITKRLARSWLAKEAVVARLRDAAVNLIAHWDSPHWKQSGPTADKIAALREAAAQREGGK